MTEMNDDAVTACADLVSRCGAAEFKIGYLHDDVPVEEAGWYAHAQFRGARITVQDRRSPGEAAMALSVRLLSGAACRCGQKVTMSDGRPGCRWRLMGARWEPGCDVPPLRVQVGDLAAARAALAERTAQGANRADRRRKKKRKGARR